MAFKITQNFDLKNTQPLDGRDQVRKADMKGFTDTVIDDGHLSYCPDDGKLYQYLYKNTVDAALGKWRELDLDSCTPLTDAQIDGIFGNVTVTADQYELKALSADDVKGVFGV